MNAIQTTYGSKQISDNVHVYTQLKYTVLFFIFLILTNGREKERVKYNKHNNVYIFLNFKVVMGHHSAEMFRNLHALRKRAFVNDGDTGLMHVHNVYLSITKSIHRKIKWIRKLTPRI